MSAQRASAPVRFARLAAAVVIITVAAVVAVRLAGRRPGPPSPSPAAPPPEGRIVDLKERVRHQEFRDGRPVADIRGASFFRGSDGRNHLAGSIEIENLGPAGETVSRLTADEVVYDPGSLRFTVSGHVRVEAAGVLLEGDSFDYDKTNGTFGTASGGVFSSKMMTGRAEEILYAEGADEVRLAGGFRVALAAAEPSGETVRLSGDSFTYARRERRGTATGRAEFSGGRARGEARSITIATTKDETRLESADFAGTARIRLAVGAPGGPGRGEVRSDRVRVSFDRDTGSIASVEAEGSADFSLRTDGGPQTIVKAPKAGLTFDPAGVLRSWAASGGIRAELADTGGSGRTIEAESAVFDAATGSLQTMGAPGRPAVADSPDVRVEAASITAGPAAGDLEAMGGVICSFKAGQGSRATGFFSPGEDVSVSGDRLVLRGGASSVSFAGNVRAWQGDKILRAGELEFSPETGDMRGRSAVVVTPAPFVANAPAGRKVELGGNEMAYSAAFRTLALTGKSYLQLPEARLEAGTISAVISGEGQAVESLSATTGVAVTKGRYTGRSAAASYQAATRLLTLTGNAILTDGKGGSARGDKLTFALADDKILIENEGQGRATTVVRS
jgi:lipopolysaccharide export system protein LptA